MTAINTAIGALAGMLGVTTPGRATRVDTRARGGRWMPVRRAVLGGSIVAAVVVAGTLNPVAVSAALATGFFNTAAGGGAVVTFLALTAVGVPALTAHATSQFVTPASFLGGFGRAEEYWPGRRSLVAGCLGTLGGVSIIKITPPGTFQAVAPWFLMAAAGLVVAQEPVRRLVERGVWALGARTTITMTFVVGVYAGLIGVGTGTLGLAVLGLAPGFVGMSLRDLLRTRNVLLLGMALVVSAAFAVTGLVNWAMVALLLLPAAVGGWLGTKVAGHLPVPVLQGLIVSTALGGAMWMLLR